jgi:hypothetical protein
MTHVIRFHKRGGPEVQQHRNIKVGGATLEC